jgi:hypothetical protein
MHILISIDPSDPSDIDEGEALLRSLGLGTRNGVDTGGSDGEAISSDGSAAPVDGPQPDPTMATTLQDEDWDYALELLFTVGRERLGSLTLFKQALTYEPGHGYTYAEIAADLGLEEAQAKAFRRNLGRALHWIERDELPGMPDIFRSWKDSGAWRYEVIPEVRAAAKRRGLI